MQRLQPDKLRDLTVVMPSFCDQDKMPKTFVELIQVLRHLIDTKTDINSAEVILVDDGNNDRTFNIMKEYSKEFRADSDIHVKVIMTANNQGRGASIREAALYSCGKDILYLEADGATNLKHIREFIECLSQGKINKRAVVIGKRNIRQAKSLNQGLINICHQLLGLQFEDTQCGLKGYSREAAQVIFPVSLLKRRVAHDEHLLLCQDLKIPVYEVKVESVKINKRNDGFSLKSLNMVRDTLSLWVHRRVGLW